jgi:hypothetical protein
VSREDRFSWHWNHAGRTRRSDYNNDMDITLSEAADSLDTTVPRVTRAIESLGIVPRRDAIGRSHRRARVLDSGQLTRLREHLGAAPANAEFSREEMFILSAFNLSPFGFRSARAAASAASVSATTAAKVLPTLVARGLVTESNKSVLDSGRVTHGVVYEANRTSDDWRTAVDDIRSTYLPESTKSTKPKLVPRRFWHLFWNATPSKLPISEHADFIASRMLLSQNPQAVAWAALHLPASSIANTAKLRHVSQRDRAWLKNLARAMSSRDLVGSEPS